MLQFCSSWAVLLVNEDNESLSGKKKSITTITFLPMKESRSRLQFDIPQLPPKLPKQFLLWLFVAHNSMPAQVVLLLRRELHQGIFIVGYKQNTSFCFWERLFSSWISSPVWFATNWTQMFVWTHCGMLTLLIEVPVQVQGRGGGGGEKSHTRKPVDISVSHTAPGRFSYN